MAFKIIRVSEEIYESLKFKKGHLSFDAYLRSVFKFDDYEFPYRNLQIGKTVLIPWPHEIGDKRNRTKLDTIRRYARRNYLKFQLNYRPEGIEVTRFV